MAEATEGHVRCPHCNKRYRWKSELAHKKVQCKQCGLKLRMPADATGTPTLLESPPSDDPEASTYGLRVPDDDQEGAAVAEPSAEQESPGGKTCPSCKATLKPEAVLCVHCGYNLQKGKKIKTQVQGDAPAAEASSGSMIEKIRDMHAEGELPIGKVILVAVMLSAGIGLIVFSIIHYF